MSDDEEEPYPEDNLGLGAEPFEEEAGDGGASSESEEEGSAAQEEDYLAARAEGHPPADPLLVQANRVRRIVELRGEDRHTADALGVNELAGLLAARAAQIDQDGVFFGVEAQPGDDAVSLARKELAARACPLMIDRLVAEKLVREGDGSLALYAYYEKWSPNELTHGAHGLA